MSFGVGFGDIVLVTTFTWKLYKSCKESSEDFRRMTTELMSLHAVLGETHDYLEEHGEELEDSRKNRLTILIDGCYSSLRDLDALYRRYESLSTQAQRSWDRVRFGLKDLSDVRQRLVSNTTLLTSFNTALINSSTTRIEKKLNKFMMEVQAGMREGSVMSGSDASTLQSPDVWAELRRELEDVGISAVVVEERHDFIVNWLKNALAGGLFEGDIDAVDIDDVGISSRSSTPINYEGISSRCLTPTDDTEQESSWYHTAHSDLSHDNSERHTVGHRLEAMSTATSAFDAEVQRARNERSVAELLAPLAVSTIYSLPPPSSSSSSFSSSSSSPSSQTSRPVGRRRRTLGLVGKLFQKQTAIVQAASDGKIDRVARLISMGMDVNAVDRWGWSALSMCGYGGHVAIARLLLDHGAKIDNIDVDGDTPKSLAAQRGHADIVIMLEEEEAIRKLRASEAESMLQGLKTT
ncbi:hypothetical protein DFH07DRAFT_771198 [Mycena maculata]|uniref:Ankyrin n=1 Tax=Mycena maculata TaxID=230809 RepID=A0AAD7JG52_9AGAR|nr:hypothetical protein DFH07DRAFT_771198 [Mycena maculata]